VALEAVELHLQPVRRRSLFLEGGKSPARRESKKVELGRAAQERRSERHERLVPGGLKAYGAGKEKPTAVGKEVRHSVVVNRHEIVEAVAIEVGHGSARLGRRE